MGGTNSPPLIPACRTFAAGQRFLRFLLFLRRAALEVLPEVPGVPDPPDPPDELPLLAAGLPVDFAPLLGLLSGLAPPDLAPVAFGAPLAPSDAAGS